MKLRGLLLLLVIALCLGACGRADEPADPVGEPTDATESSESATDRKEKEPAEGFENFGTQGDYVYDDEVEGNPVTDYGVYREDGESEHYTANDKNTISNTGTAQGGYSPAPKPNSGSQNSAQPNKTPAETATEPTEGKTEPTEGKTEPTEGKTEPTEGKTEPTEGKTEPTEGKTEPTEGKTEPTEGETEPTEPDEPKPTIDRYAQSVAAIGDYGANVRFVCKTTLSDGSTDRYEYTYQVSRTGKEYSVTYKDKGKEQTATFSEDSGTMVTPNGEKNATLSDFYRFCSMVDPLPLSAYYYESSAAGTQISALLPASAHKELLLNTSGLFSGFDKLSGDVLVMGDLYYRAMLDASDAYKSSTLAFDFALTDKILGLMEFDVSIEVEYAA